MTTAPPEIARRLTRSAQEFYWSVLTLDEAAPKGRRVRPTRDFLDSLFEEDLPLSLSELHAVYTPLPNGRFLTCAAPRALLAALPPDTLSLTPESVPESLGIDAGDLCGHLNLLTGDFEPRELVRERSKRWTIAAVTCMACSLLLTIGLARRAASARDSARAFDGATIGLAKAALPDKTPTLTSAAYLTKQELTSLRTLRSADASSARTPDAVAPLVDLLGRLPRTTSLRTDVLAVTPQTITLNVATDADPQVFLKGLTPPAGWTLDEPRLTASRGEGATTLAIQMRRAPQAQTANGTPGGSASGDGAFGSGSGGGSGGGGGR